MKILILSLALAAMSFGQTVVNGGRSHSGPIDHSGATTTKPFKSGTSLPATCAAGEAYYKTDATSGFQLYTCVATDSWKPSAGLGLKSLTLFDPVAGDSGRIQLMFPTAVTITRIACSVKAATSASINFDERAAATPDTAGTDVLSSALVCDTDEASTTTFANASIAARVPLALTLTVSGTPDTLRVFVEYMVN